MLKAGRQLQETLYPDMIHITCVAHVMNRVAEFVRDSHPKTDKLVAALKKILLKGPRRKRKYTKKPQLPLPPQAVITRWVTWLEAVFYYPKNFETVAEHALNLNDDTIAISTAKLLLEDPEIKGELAFIASNFKYLADCVTKLEGSLSLGVVFEILNDVDVSFTGLHTLEKFQSALKRNPGLEVFRRFNRVINGEGIYLHKEIPEDSMLFKNAPRSVSRWSNFFRNMEPYWNLRDSD